MRTTHRFTLPLFITLIAVTVCGGFEPCPSAAANAPMLAPEVGVFDGYFMLHDHVPRGFKGFEAFELNTVKFTPSGQTVPIKPYGVVHAGRKFKMARINIEGDSLSFETISLGGATYQFSGKLLRTTDPNGPVLSGRLTRTVNGKKAAEAEVAFDLVEGD